MIDELQSRDEYDSTLFVVMSDHGEDLGERGMPRPARHGHGLYDEQIKVPMIMRLPRLFPSGTRVENQVRLLDLMPTILETMQWETPPWCHGKSLFSLIRSQETQERIAISEGMTYGYSQISLRTNHYKLLKLKEPLTQLDSPPTGVEIKQPQPLRLFHIDEDPDEQINIKEQNPDKLKELQRVMNIFQQNMATVETFTEGRLQEIPQMSASMIEELQSHGYMGDG